MNATVHRIETPIAPLRALIAGGALLALDFGMSDEGGGESSPAADRALAQRIQAQIDVWWAGRRSAFELPLAPLGTRFQRAVWTATSAVPRGSVITYAALAERLGNRAAARAVGAALGRNPWLLVVPCHRVVAGDGGLTGYAGGVERKRLLLAAEGVVLSPGASMPELSPAPRASGPAPARVRGAPPRGRYAVRPPQS